MLPSSTDRFKEYKKVIIPVYGVFRTIKNLTKLQRLNNEEYYTNALFKWRLDKSIYKLSEEDRQELKKYDCEAIRNQLFSQYCITDNEVYNFDDYLKSCMIDFDAFLSIFHALFFISILAIFVFLESIRTKLSGCSLANF